MSKVKTIFAFQELSILDEDEITSENRVTTIAWDMAWNDKKIG